MNLNSLDNMPRLLLEADLRPVAGQRFQPTGFGPAAATITVISDDPSSPATVNVSGNSPAGTGRTVTDARAF